MSKIVYLYSRPKQEAAHIERDAVWIDWPETHRSYLTTLMRSGGLRPGDTLIILAKGDLGHGARAAQIYDEIKSLGVKIEITPLPKKQKKKAGRSPKRVLAPEHKDAVCGCWCSAMDSRDAIEQISRLLGFSVDRNWLNNNCGYRSGSRKTK